MSEAIVNSPELGRLFATAAQLARPVVRGWLPPNHANAALLCAAIAAARTSGGDEIRLWRVAQHVMNLSLRSAMIRRSEAAAQIERTLRPLLDGHRPSNMLLAEAHGANGAAGFVFAEDEVTEIARGEVRRFLRRRHRATR